MHRNLVLQKGPVTILTRFQHIHYACSLTAAQFNLLLLGTLFIVFLRRGDDYLPEASWQTLKYVACLLCLALRGGCVPHEQAQALGIRFGSPTLWAQNPCLLKVVIIIKSHTSCQDCRPRVAKGWGRAAVPASERPAWNFRPNSHLSGGFGWFV